MFWMPLLGSLVICPPNKQIIEDFFQDVVLKRKHHYWIADLLCFQDNNSNIEGSSDQPLCNVMMLLTWCHSKKQKIVSIPLTWANFHDNIFWENYPQHHDQRKGEAGCWWGSSDQRTTQLSLISALSPNSITFHSAIHIFTFHLQSQQHFITPSSWLCFGPRSILQKRLNQKHMGVKAVSPPAPKTPSVNL